MFQERQNVRDLQQKLETETSRLRREHERDIELLANELKNAKHQLEQQLQQQVCLLATVHSATIFLNFASVCKCHYIVKH